MKAKGRKGKLGMSGLLAVAVGSVLVALAKGDTLRTETDVSEPVPPRVLVAATQAIQEQPSYLVRRSFVGRIEARRSTDTGFELGGAVLRILFDEGDAVAKGQMLARLDTKRLGAKRAELEARLHEAEARLSLMRSTRERTLEALELNAVSTQQWDEADLGYVAQAAVVRRVAAQIESIDVDIEKSRLRAPFAGVVARRFVDEGAVVSAGEPLFRLLEMGRPEVRVGISVELAKSLKIGDERVVRADGRELSATVRALLPARNRETRTVDVVLTLSTKENALRHGDLVELELSQAIEKSGFWLPRSALTESSRGLWASYVAAPLGSSGSSFSAAGPSMRSNASALLARTSPPLDGLAAEGGTASAVRDSPDRSSSGSPYARAEGSSSTHILKRRELELLHVDGDSVFVRGTLTSGELVVTEGLQRLVPNQRVALGRESDR